MKKYTASEELTSILLNNGFTETTEKNLPWHYAKRIENGYNPNDVKREFSYNNKRVILFDYVIIKPIVKGSTNGKELKKELSLDELKSIIVFLKLPHQTISALKRGGQLVTDLYLIYNLIKEHPEITDSKNRYRNELIVKGFESVKI